MKKFEVLLGVIVLLTIIVCKLGISISFSLIVIPILILANFYYFLSFALFNNVSFLSIFRKESYNQISVQRILFAIGTGFALSLILVAVVFVIKDWPLADFTLAAGLLLLAVLFLIASIRFLVKRSSYLKWILIRLLSYGLLGLYFYLF